MDGGRTLVPVCVVSLFAIVTSVLSGNAVNSKRYMFG